MAQTRTATRSGMSGASLAANIDRHSSRYVWAARGQLKRAVWALSTLLTAMFTWNVEADRPSAWISRASLGILTVNSIGPRLLPLQGQGDAASTFHWGEELSNLNGIEHNFNRFRVQRANSLQVPGSTLLAH
uniref:Uncharacterized protein n=1 Tax=Oryza brachyantha TaxID=4533 RepID=J3MB90_ORYBR